MTDKIPLYDIPDEFNIDSSTGKTGVLMFRVTVDLSGKTTITDGSGQPWPQKDDRYFPPTDPRRTRPL